MGRAPNFYYQSPVGDIAKSFATAIFGDPAKANAQAVAQAQAAERAAHTRVYNSQAEGYENQNRASQSLPELIASLRAPAAPPAPSLDDPAFLDGAGPSERPPSADEVFRNNLPGFVAALAQMQGDKVDTTETVGSLASFLGGDEMARRGLVAQGHSPTKDFAITPERADDIAQQGYDAKLGQALGVATINNRDDIPVANIRAGASRDVATINNRDDIPVANIAAGSRENVANIKAAGPAPGFDAILKAYPNARMTGGPRTPERNREVGGVENSDHLNNKPGISAFDTDVIPGVSIEQRKAAIEAANPGVRVIDARRHRAKRPDGTLGGLHDHFSLQNIAGPAKGGRAAAAAKPPKAITPKQKEMVEGELTQQLESRGLALSPNALAVFRAGALTNFQSDGNPVTAARNAIEVGLRNGRDNINKRRGQKPAATAPAPRAGPGGNRSGSGPVRVSSPAQAQALKPGTRYTTPDGKTFVR